MSATAPAGEHGGLAAPAKRSNRKAVLLGLCILAALGASAWGLRWWTVGRFIESTDDAYLQADSVTAAPKISGYVVEVYVADNQTVSAGQPLVRLDPRPYEVSLQQANATIAAREADIARAQAELAQQQASIAQARAQLDGAKASDAYASDQLTRYAPLAATGAETDERVAELRNARKQAAATLAADAAALDAAQRQIPTTQAQVLQARAQLAAAQASASQAKLDLGDTVVRSTIAGRIGDRAVRAGQYAQPGTRLMTIVPVQDVYLEANFKETQLGLMRVGQPATIHVDALAGDDLHGTVDSFSPGTGSQFALLPPQNATGNFTKIVQRVPVRIRIDAPEAVRARLLPGLSVTVRVDTRGARAALDGHEGDGAASNEGGSHRG
ncbi:HlyD family secretion protein [Pararobbsia silviterrae]|uniref:HlyD family secretion protein n=1 Tax=Pararobbsia silviterrae TaxID=1792498 RepID=A0A494XZG1_9BURK|nr:HlyD family secretion protein [Pararobbsia silviterrae]RKP55907.1 HlyD family secretion protein [Pararobbsia silviterrae]